MKFQWVPIALVLTWASNAVYAEIPESLFKQIMKDSFPETVLKDLDKSAFGRPTAKDFTVSWTDLDNDMTADPIVTIQHGGYCGSGGCTVWVYRGKGETFKQLLEMQGLIDPQLDVLNRVMNGMKNIVLVGGSAHAPSFTVFYFNGEKYVSSN